MRFPSHVTHEFVETVPPEREPGKIYVSIPYATAVHNCLCGCGMKVVTPIKPHKWSLGFNGETISLYPSVGNWSFACRSHYWIRDGQVTDAGPMRQQAIERGRACDAILSDRHYGAAPATKSLPQVPDAPAVGLTAAPAKRGIWAWLLDRWRR